jgi:hypothetical protein
MMSRLFTWVRTAFFFGAPAERPTFFFSRWLFLRLLGVVYLAAFLSLWVQIHGLIGSRGILPVAEYLTAIHRMTGGDGYYLAPTLFWLNSSDQFISGLCAGGVILSSFLILGLAQVPVLLLLWAFYLSLTIAGQDFLSYQWDALLLETGFLAIFLAPFQLWSRPGHELPPSRAVLWLFRWLLFRLMFVSGVVKLRSGDPSWCSLTALQYHYETQPLPTWTSWHMHQLPGWFQQFSVLVTFGVELLVPLLIFGPRRCRHAACAGIVGLQLLIAATGNYGFFNLLSIVLCIPLLEDDFFPARLRGRFLPRAIPGTGARMRTWSHWLALPLAGGILLMSLMPFLQNVHWPGWLVRAHRIAAAFRLVNGYGLFAVMTTRRPEIIVEGSNDAQTWRPYEFRWKPGDPKRRPSFTGLHLPRLDWQMWFAALGRCQDNDWFVRFLSRLAEGGPDVLRLLDRNPFPDRPPRYIRAILYQYHFTNETTRRQEGAWWRRVPIGLYCQLAPGGTD